jgi:iterative type I PKS product template protein
MAAIHAACNSLWLHDCDTAVAGGCNVMTNPDIFSGLSKGQFLSKTGPCQTFDNDADGYCRGDAVATLVLKRLTDAEADHDNVLGIIRSVATNHSADAISITHPHAGTQENLYRRVLSQARVNFQDISYVEMHGTGTQAGDHTEMSSVTSIFAPLGSRSNEQKVYVGSVKANVGHGEASSGVTALIKTLLMMRHNLIPPHIGVKKTLNKGFPDFAERNIHIAKEPVSWKCTSSQSRKVFVNNFSAAGGNTAMVITDGKVRSLRGFDPRTTQVVAVSARALSSLKANLKNLFDYLIEHPNVSLPSLSYTTTSRRIHHNYRFSVSASNVDQVKSALARAMESDILPVPQAPRVVMTFTGQGTMYPAAGSDLFRMNKVYRSSLIEFNSICISYGFPKIQAVVDGSDDRSLLEHSPVLLQVAQVSIQMALIRLWNALGVIPDVVIGHSLGEYAALFASGVLSAADTIYLVGSRARLMEMNCTVGTHTMLAIQGGDLSSDLTNSHKSRLACINSGKEFVLSVLAADVETFKRQFEGLGYTVTPLAVPYAFHSSQVDAILAPFRDLCSRVTFRKPKCEILSPTLGRSLGKSVIGPDYLCRHARQTVNFYGALCDAQSNGLITSDSAFLEIGPSPVCNAFVRSTLGSSVTTCASLHRKKKPWDNLAHAASDLSNRGIKIDWGEYHREFEDSLELLELPSYAWAQSNYWIDYQNDWCLNKGINTAPSQRYELPDFIPTTSVHRVIKERFGDHENILDAETDLSLSGIRCLLRGHMVNNVALCPSSLYGDIGITIGAYMHRKMNPHLTTDSAPGMNVRDMAVQKTLISGDMTPHIISINAKASESKQSIQMNISSQEGQHASFVVEFYKESECADEWRRIEFLVESRMESLREQRQGHEAHVLSQAVVYKLFSAFVDYEKTFQGMKKVYLSPLHWEATADVVLEAPGADQTFTVPPYWIDSIGHLSGFVLNAHLTDHNPKSVYVSHGWESLRLAKTLVLGKKYRTYVRMEERTAGNLVTGDLYCFEKSSVIAVFSGITFMRIPRTVLDQILPRSQSTTSRPAKIPEERAIEPRKASPVEVSPLEIGQKKIQCPSLLSQVLAIVAEECGIDQSELADPISFADLGVDSLMQLAISSRIREEISLEISSTIFIDNPTVGSLKTYIRCLNDHESPECIDQSLSSTTAPHGKRNPSSIFSITDDTILSTEDTEDWESNDPDHQEEKKYLPLQQSLANISTPIPEKHATSFLLQGNSRTASQKLFLIPDGGGSATSYTQIPDLSPDIAVYGLNSPFMTTPEEYTCGVSGIAQYFVQEIRKRQESGPYNIGVSLSSEYTYRHSTHMTYNC